MVANVPSICVRQGIRITKIKIQMQNQETKVQQPHISPDDANTVLPAVRLSMEEILKDAVRRQATYQVQFADYDLHTWTAPCQLTENRMEKLLNDGSIRKVRLELEM